MITTRISSYTGKYSNKNECTDFFIENKTQTNQKYSCTYIFQLIYLNHIYKSHIPHVQLHFHEQKNQLSF